MPPTPADHERSTATRHSKEDALDERGFELLLEGARRLDDYFSLQARFVILVCGRLGLRVGELAHIREGWVNWRDQVIEIPRYQACDKGRGGGICGQCAQSARQMADLTEERDLADMKARMWGPKTDEAVREVPFDVDARSELVVERFFDRWGRWPLSQQVCGRRVKRSAEASDELKRGDVYAHCLRATAASHWAARGLDVLHLQSMFGWAQPSTARCYVTSSTEATRRALHMTFGG